MKRETLAALAAAAVAALLYAGTLSAGFLTYDDPALVLEPEVVREPTLRHVLDTLAAPIAGSYHPLHTLSYVLDARVHGLDHPGGFHATNVLLFALATALVLAAARRFGASTRGAGVAALLFAVHPSHVESVAWLSERKDCLVVLFVLLALSLAPRSGEPARRWLGTLGLYVLALASKTSAVALAPFLALEAWLDRRLDRRTVAWLAPFALLTVAWLAIEVHTLREAGYTRTLDRGPPSARVRTVVWNLAWYPRRFLDPAPLTPRPDLGLTPEPGAQDLAALATLVGVGALALASLRRDRFFARLAAWFYVALAPISGIVPTTTDVQDRYLLLPSIAACTLLGEVLVRFARRGRLERALALVAAAALAFHWSLASAVYARAWHDDESLWSYVCEADPGNAYGHLGLSGTAFARGDRARARLEAERARGLGAGWLADAFLARIAEAEGRPGEALSLLRDAFRGGGDPALGVALVRLALAQGDAAAADEAAREVASHDPRGFQAKLARAYLEHARGDVALAFRDYDAAAPRIGSADAWLGLAQAARDLGHLDRAGEALAAAERAGAPPFALASERAFLALARADFAAAESAARAGLALEPRAAPVRRALGLALAGEGRLAPAAETLEALVADTGDPLALYDLARVRSRAGERDRAREALARAVAARPDLRARAAHDPLLQGLEGPR